MKWLSSFLFAGLAVAAPSVTPINGELAAVAARDNSIEARQSNIIRVESITASGNGCPSGSWTASYTPSRDTGTISFSQYDAALPSPSNRACTVTVSLTYPSGCTSGTFQGTNHGFAQVNSGVTATYRTSYTSNTGNNANPPISTFSGPSWANGNTFTKTDLAPGKVVNRSPNTARVTYTATTQLNAGSGSGASLTIDDISFKVTGVSVNPNWQTCN